MLGKINCAVNVCFKVKMLSPAFVKLPAVIIFSMALFQAKMQKVRVTFVIISDRICNYLYFPFLTVFQLYCVVDSSLLMYFVHYYL